MQKNTRQHLTAIGVAIFVMGTIVAGAYMTHLHKVRLEARIEEMVNGANQENTTNKEDIMNDTNSETFQIYGETFHLSANKGNDCQRLYEVLLKNGWSVARSDVVAPVNAAETVYGTAVASGQGLQTVKLSEGTNKAQIVLTIDTGTLPGKKKDFYDCPLTGFEITGYRDDLPEFFCSGWEPWMDEDDTAQAIGTSYMVESGEKIDGYRICFVTRPDLYPEENYGSMITISYYNDKDAMGEPLISFLIEAEK